MLKTGNFTVEQEIASGKNDVIDVLKSKMGRCPYYGTVEILDKVLLQKNAIKKAMEVLGQRYQTRPGGYTRMTKLGPRQGDGAEMVQIELV